LVSKADLLVESTLDEANLKPSDITDVFLVGGSTRMPMVKAHLVHLFNKEPVCYVNPDEVVALGAALYAGFKADTGQLNAAQVSAVRSMKLKEVANHFFGTISLQDDSATGRIIERVSILIEKNAPLPCSKVETYHTIVAGQQQVRCRVVQSATRETDPDFVRVIWEGELGPLPAGRPAGMEVRVTYSYDTNQIMHCIFEDVASGMKREIRLGVQSDNVDSSQGVERFVVE
jgi:molecular chaperone DnaK (HSP70)